MELARGRRSSLAQMEPMSFRGRETGTPWGPVRLGLSHGGSRGPQSSALEGHPASLLPEVPVPATVRGAEDSQGH